MPYAERVAEGTQPVSQRKLAALLRSGAALAGSLELPDVLQTAIASAVDVLGLDAGVIYELDGDELYLGATVPPLPADFPDEHRHAHLEDHPHIRHCLEGLSPLMIEDALQQEMTPQERVVVESRGLRSGVFAPLAVEGRPLGVMIVQSIGRVVPFADEDVDLCRTVAHQISLALANARLFQRVRRSSIELSVAYDATLRGWAAALEMRDKETSGHTARVAERAVALARDMGVPEEDLVHMRRGALLHDIGKMSIPDAILHKPGPLTDDEWAIMRRHPEQALVMLSEIDYLTPVLEIVYCHHECWDGSGYPRGLKGDTIPLLARIFTVIDVYDALISDRPYRAAWSRKKAEAYIRQQSGTQFDPRVATAFLEELEVAPW